MSDRVQFNTHLPADVADSLRQRANELGLTLGELVEAMRSLADRQGAGAWERLAKEIRANRLRASTR